MSDRHQTEAEDEDANVISRLSREVSDILRARGIKATHGEVITWARGMVDKYLEMRGKRSEVRMWLAGVVRNMTIPTMCLHLHFGDAKECEVPE